MSVVHDSERVLEVESVRSSMALVLMSSWLRLKVNGIGHETPRTGKVEVDFLGRGPPTVCHNDTTVFFGWALRRCRAP